MSNKCLIFIKDRRVLKGEISIISYINLFQPLYGLDDTTNNYIYKICDVQKLKL